MREDFPEEEGIERVMHVSPSESSHSGETNDRQHDTTVQSDMNVIQNQSELSSKTSHQSNFRSQYPSISIVVVIIGIAPAAIGVFLVWINRVVCSRFSKKKNQRLTSSSSSSSPSDTSSTCEDSSRFFEMQVRESSHSDQNLVGRTVFHSKQNHHHHQEASKETITIQLPLNIIQGDKHGNHHLNRSHAHVVINREGSAMISPSRQAQQIPSSLPSLPVKGRRRAEIVAHILQNQERDQRKERIRKSRQLSHDYRNDLDGQSYPRLEVCRQNLLLIKILGEGNFGQVWKGQMTATNDLNSGSPSSSSSLVAVKMSKVNSSEEDQLELLREIEIMIKLFSSPSSTSQSSTLLSHPNVVGLVGYCIEAGKFMFCRKFEFKKMKEGEYVVEKERKSMTR